MEPSKVNDESDGGGAGTKRKLCKSTAAIKSNEVVKRCKGTKQQTKHDPVKKLTEVLCHEIFSYLCEKPETFDAQIDGSACVVTTCKWLVKTAGKLCSTLRSVSPLWKQTFDSVNWADQVGLVHVDFEEVPDCSHIALVQWLCRYKIRLGTIRKRGSLPLPTYLQLFRECQTENLQGLHIPGWTPRTTDKLEITTFESAQMMLHDLIADYCPNLQLIGLNLYLPTTFRIGSFNISSHLFSLQSMTTLHINVIYFGGTPTSIEQNIYTLLIQNLPNLKNLIILCNENSHEIFQNRRFHIASPTLEKLDVTKSCNGMVFSVNCPRLKRFVCDAGPEGNGCLPSLPRVFFEHLMTHNDNTSRSTWALAYDGVELDSSPQIQVPENCLVHFHNFSLWGMPGQGYDKFRLRCQQFENASYHTFQGEAEAGEG